MAKTKAKSKSKTPAKVDYPIKIVSKHLSELKHDPKNPRKITDDAFAGLCKSIERYGYVEPIVYNRQTGEIVGGHRRYDAIIKRSRGKDLLIDVIEIDISPREQRELNIELNNQHIQGEFDPDKLQIALDEIKIDFDPEDYHALCFDRLDIKIDDIETEIDTQIGGKDESGRLNDQFAIVITCENEVHQVELLQEFAERGLQCRALVS